MKKFRLCIFLLCCYAVSFSQQSGNNILKGSVRTTSESPVGFATVTIRELARTTSCDTEGKFSFNNVPAGTYTIETSSVGYATAVQQVHVKSGTTEISIQLTDNESQLEEVIVSAGRTTETIDQVPSSVTVLGLKTLQQNINITTNIADILENRVPGLAPSTGLSSNFGQTLRGRSLLIMVDGIPQSTPLRNGAMDLRALDPAVIERVEVVKGATAIYGNGAAGGLINYITRSAKTDKIINSHTSVGATGSLTKMANSMGGRISQLLYGDKGKFSYVLSGVYEQTGEYKDADGDVLPPVYALGETDSYNAFAKIGYAFNDNHKVQAAYNFYSSR